MALNPQLQQRLRGMMEPKGLEGILSRGANVYNGTSLASHRGGGIDYPQQRRSPGSSMLAPPTNPPNQGLVSSPNMSQMQPSVLPPPGPTGQYPPDSIGAQGGVPTQDQMLSGGIPPPVASMLSQLASRRLYGSEDQAGPQAPAGPMGPQAGPQGQAAPPGISQLPTPGLRSALALARLKSVMG